MDVESSISSSYVEHARMSNIRSSFRVPLHYRCTQCNARQKENSRNLVVCIDGTSNQFGQNNTNVVKLFAKIDLETTHPEQFTYYCSGIGTSPKSFIINRSWGALSEKIDMAVASGIGEIVKDVYTWLARTYEEGDQIYLFGFSRGAYQVRLLAAMIYEVGLVRTPTERQIATAYDHYEAIRLKKPTARQAARKFMDTFSWSCLRVHFIGVWDTVSSRGLIKQDAFLSMSPAHACHIRHALALDEFRVKFMPEYFNGMNSQTDNGKSKYIVTSDDDRHSTASDNESYPWGKKNKTAEIKEVWFAGCHSDVGGTSRVGRFSRAGNVSLLWMRREATACGLVLQPTDVIWVPDDIDFGTSDSMTRIWRVVEYIPIKHQVSFSGTGEDARRAHQLQPRRIIPGQKVHASILYANTYKPRASLGEGFDILIVRDGLDRELDPGVWETGLFDDTAAQELVAYLGGQQGVAPIYLDRLLFMLRFKEGKQCVRNVPNWQNQLMSLIHNPDCAPLIRLVTIVAYYEASCDPDANSKSPPLPHVELPQRTFDDAKKGFSDVLAQHKHRDGPRVVALLRPLTKHQVLRERILTPEVLETLVRSLDATINRIGGNFGQAMDGLSCLLQCEDTRMIIIEKLGGNCPYTNVTRLSRILEVNDPHLLTAALCMVMTLARIPDAKQVCLGVKPRLRELAAKKDRLIGLLAVEILLALYDQNDQAQQLNIRNANVRANLASALVHLQADERDSADEQGRPVDPGQQTLRQLFGLDATELSDIQRTFIRELRIAVRKGNSRKRTPATFTLLKLCEAVIIRTFLREIGLLEVFINQLQRKDTALLAAYALTTCLKYPDMKESIKDNALLLKNIVCMLRLDYFDEAIGQVEGFQVFGDFMQHADLREKIKRFNITEVLEAKLAKGKSKETRTSLICLDIFRSYDRNGPWARELVANSLKRLRNPEWQIQKGGVAILTALAQTEHGMAAIKPKIYQIVEMLLPEGYLPISPTAPGMTAEGTISPSEAQVQPVVAPEEAADPEPDPGPDALLEPPSWMMGPACALRILVQDETLRNITRGTVQYGSLKHLYLSGTLVDEKDTSPWRIKTPNRADVIGMLDMLIETVDEEVSAGDISVEDTALPHIVHWDRLMKTLSGGTITAVSDLPVLLGVSALTVLSVIMVAPIYLSYRAFAFFERAWSRYQDFRISKGLRQIDHGAFPPELSGESDLGMYEGNGIVSDGEAPGDGEHSQDIEIVSR